MTTLRKISVGLLGIAWIALVVAGVGVVFTPWHHCSYEGSPIPTGLLAARIGLIVTGCAVFLGVFSVAADEETSSFGFLKVIAIGGATVATGVVIGILSTHQTASWGCG
jgi:hypothetical protein